MSQLLSLQKQRENRIIRLLRLQEKKAMYMSLI